MKELAVSILLLSHELVVQKARATATYDQDRGKPSPAQLSEVAQQELLSCSSFEQLILLPFCSQFIRRHKRMPLNPGQLGSNDF